MESRDSGVCASESDKENVIINGGPNGCTGNKYLYQWCPDTA